MEDRASISAILKVAKNDPNHRDALKEIQKSNDLLFYDSAKLSAVLQCLEQIRFEKKEKRRNVLRDLCVSGYPDIQPWQVRSACLSQVDSNETNDHCSDSIMEYLYYTYLCHLLNPVDGHEGARQDLDLLKEFCEWSVGVKPKEETNPTRMENFLSIAASSSSHHKKYRRDLIMLMDLSLAINNHELALTLVDEITVNAKLLSNKDALHSVLCCLQKIGAASLTLCSDPSKQRAGFETLKKVLKLFEKMSSSDSLVCRNSINVPDELLTLFQKWKIESRSNGDDRKMYLLIDFVIDVSSVPADVIKALLLWSPNHDGKFIFSRVENLLRRGVHFAVFNCELSGTLLRLNYARTTFEGLDSIDKDTGRRGDTTNMNRIWDRMGTGDVSINK